MRTWKTVWLLDPGAHEMRGRVQELGNIVPSCGSSRQGAPDVPGFEKSGAGSDGTGEGPLVSIATQSPLPHVTPVRLEKSVHFADDEQLLGGMMPPLLLPPLLLPKPPLLLPPLLPKPPLLPPPLEPVKPPVFLPLDAQAAATTAARPMASNPRCENTRIRIKTKNLATETSTST
jgi:hypothetical protein